MSDSSAQPERPGVVQRAFEIAKNGEVADVTALNAKLAAEGCAGSIQTLAGRSILQQLTRIILGAGGNK